MVLNSGTPVRAGDQAPDFSVSDQFGQTVTLSEYRDTNVLLVFVPFAFSSVCTSELAALRDAADLRAGRDLEIMVASCDAPYTLQAWGEAENFPGILVSDFWPHGEVAKSYGVFNEVLGIATRGTFLIDKTGKVAWSVVNTPGEARRVDDYRSALAQLG